MSTISMPLSAHQPRERPRWRRTEAGGWDVTLLLVMGRVDVFTYPGGEHGPAFTTLTTYVSNWKYETRLPRAYHKRWIGRLANDFVYRAWHDARAKGRVGKDAWPW